MDNVIIPITVRRSVFMKTLTDIINNSGLPFFVVEDAMKDMLSNVHAMADKQLKQDLEMYEESLKKVDQNVSK